MATWPNYKFCNTKIAIFRKKTSYLEKVASINLLKVMYVATKPHKSSKDSRVTMPV